MSWLAVCEADLDLETAYEDFEKVGGLEGLARQKEEVKRGQVGGRIPRVLYLEGGDQHRGWFHSSLLTSVALRGLAPYSHVATAGWTLDEQGRAMSKSLGNGVDPVDIANRMGGEIVRLWVASVDFREDMAASENLMPVAPSSTKSCATPSAFCSATCRIHPESDQVKDPRAVAA